MKAIAALLALFSTLATGQDRIEGLVEIPALHGRVNSGAPDITIGPVPLFAEPDQEADVAVVVRNRRQLESREHGYEQVSATVYAREGNSSGGFWYQLRFVDTDEPLYGWLNQADAGQYRTIHDTVRSGLTFFTDEWDRRLFEVPSQDSPARSFERLELEDRPDVRVADIRFENGEPWYLVVLLRGNVCGDGGTDVLGTGWVPAYSESGGLTVWHYSRGC